MESLWYWYRKHRFWSIVQLTCDKHKTRPRSWVMVCGPMNKTFHLWAVILKSPHVSTDDCNNEYRRDSLITLIVNLLSFPFSVSYDISWCTVKQSIHWTNSLTAFQIYFVIIIASYADHRLKKEELLADAPLLKWIYLK